MFALGEMFFQGMLGVEKGFEVLAPHEMFFEGMEEFKRGVSGVCTG